MNKKFNLAISILCIIEIICCFVPFCLDEEYWKYEQSMTYHGVSKLTSHSDISLFGNEAALGKPLAILFVCVAIVVAVIYFIKMLDYNTMLDYVTKITDKVWILAIAHTVTMVMFLFYSCVFAEVDEISYRYEYGINWMSYIIIALNLIVLIIAILQKFGKVNKISYKKQETSKVQKESVDDLLAYKELLDSGVISQEEFELKKKQILG